jgi:hypothetical protein
MSPAGKRCDMVPEEVNEWVIRKTISGPKRFRPLTREELENKVIDLEKKVAKGASGKGSSGSAAGSAAASVVNGDAKSVVSITASQRQQQHQRPSSASASAAGSVTARSRSSAAADPKSVRGSIAAGSKEHKSGVGVAGDGDFDEAISSNDLLKFATLVDDLNNMKVTIEAKASIIDQQRTEIARLRSRNAELSVFEDQEDFDQREYRELRNAFDSVSADLDDTTRRLASCMQENMQLRAEATVGLDDQQAELQGLHDQCERLLKQNSRLLETITSLELELEQVSNRGGAYAMNTNPAEAAAEAAAAVERSKNAAISALEAKLLRVTDKLKASEDKCASLTADVSQISTLKESLRDKNLEIRSLQKALDAEKSKNSRSATAAAASQSGGQDTNKLAELMEENKRLKQALTAATTALPGGGGTRTGSPSLSLSPSQSPRRPTASESKVSEGKHDDDYDT